MALELNYDYEHAHFRLIPLSSVGRCCLACNACTRVGLETTKHHVCQTGWWPRSNSNITNATRSCRQCQFLLQNQQQEPILSKNKPLWSHQVQLSGWPGNVLCGTYTTFATTINLFGRFFLMICISIRLCIPEALIFITFVIILPLLIAHRIIPTWKHCWGWWSTSSYTQNKDFNRGLLKHSHLGVVPMQQKSVRITLSNDHISYTWHTYCHFRSDLKSRRSILRWNGRSSVSRLEPRQARQGDFRTGVLNGACPAPSSCGRQTFQGRSASLSAQVDVAVSYTQP